jgi:hypothetical protein
VVESDKVKSNFLSTFDFLSSVALVKTINVTSIASDRSQIIFATNSVNFEE